MEPRPGLRVEAKQPRQGEVISVQPGGIFTVKYDYDSAGFYKSYQPEEAGLFEAIEVPGPRDPDGQAAYSSCLDHNNGP